MGTGKFEIDSATARGRHEHRHCTEGFAKKEEGLTTPEKRAEEKTSKVGGIAALERRDGKTYAPAKGILCAGKTREDGEGFTAGFALKGRVAASGAVGFAAEDREAQPRFEARRDDDIPV